MPVSISRYEFKHKKWILVARMINARCLFSLAVAHGFLYAIGGQDRKKNLKLVERYDADTDAWEKVRSMTLPLSSAAVAVHRNYIYIIGGATKYNLVETATVERFDGDSWTTVKNKMKRIPCQIKNT